jgi:hypothetical protein
MKTKLTQFLAPGIFSVVASIAALLTVFLVGCGKSSSSNSAAGGAANTTPTCAAGQVYVTAYKQCLSQAGCAAGYVMYNNQCVSSGGATANQCTTGYAYHSTYGCLPQAGCPSGYVMYNNQCIVATTAPSSSNSCQGTCAAGTIQTANGCFPQGGCASCYGYNANDNYCYPSVNYSNNYNGYNF